MQRILGFLTLLAAALLATALLLGSAPVGVFHAAGGNLDGTVLRIDMVSFGLGFAAGIVVMLIYRVPWGELPERIGMWLQGLRRIVVLMGLAAMFAGFLLLY